MCLAGGRAACTLHGGWVGRIRAVGQHALHRLPSLTAAALGPPAVPACAAAGGGGELELEHGQAELVERGPEHLWHLVLVQVERLALGEQVEAAALLPANRANERDAAMIKEHDAAI